MEYGAKTQKKKGGVVGVPSFAAREPLRARAKRKKKDGLVDERKTQNKNK
jgi:hypothetical protein